MDGSNVHTSVVIEVANQEEPDDQNTYKIDFDDVDTPKDYIIDEIFCGENITVYALFEMTDVTNQNSNRELIEVSKSNLNEDFRFIQGNFYKTFSPKKLNWSKESSPEKKPRDHIESLSKYKNKSFYCLKNVGEHYRLQSREKEKSELELLYSRDVVSKPSKCKKNKTESKGVNTDISQSPKLIEEIQKAVTLNFGPGKTEGKTIEITNVSSKKPSCKVFELEVKSSILSLTSDKGKRKKSSSKFLFVPVLMVDDPVKNQSQKGADNGILLKKNVAETEKKNLLDTATVGTNTDVNDLIFPTSEKNIKRENYLNDLIELESFNMEIKKHEEHETEQLKKDKVSILSEIKKLQRKLNTLIRSVEFINLNTCEQEEKVKRKRKGFEKKSEKLEPTLEPLLVDPRPMRRNHKKFDDLPIFSPLIYPCNKNSRSKSKKRNQHTDREERKKNFSGLKKAGSFSSLNQKELKKMPTSQNIREKRESKLKLKSFRSLEINLNELESWKGLGISKSDETHRSTMLMPKFYSLNTLKKSASFDLREDKTENQWVKKIKNASFKLEGNLKTNLRIIQNGEVSLGDNLTSLKCEMGDEVNKKLKISKTELLNVAEVVEKKTRLQKIKLDGKQILKDEGDAKLIFPERGMVPQTILQNTVVHFCRTNSVSSDGVLKTEKKLIPCRSNLKATEKHIESISKAPSDSEKPSTPNKNSIKVNLNNSKLKKEVKQVKKLNSKNKIPERYTKPEAKDSHEPLKPKSVSGCRKSIKKDTADSKLHVDKLIKKSSENDSKIEVNCNQKIPQAAKHINDEKSEVKLDRHSRPHSQKRPYREHLRQKAREGKESEKSNPKTSLGSSEKSLLDLTLQDNFNRVMVFESKKQMQESEFVSSDDFLHETKSSLPVLVELFCKKPTNASEGADVVSQKRPAVANTVKVNIISDDDNNTNEPESSTNENVDSEDKSVVKSVWALTKVLVYEDGTKKLEVLEASLNPPDYRLNSTDKGVEER